MVARRSFYAGLLALLVAFPALANDLGTKMFKDRHSCYMRTYTAEHLAAHPAQTVRDVSLYRVPEMHAPDDGRLWLVIDFRLRDRAETLDLYAACTATNTKISCRGEGETGSFTLTPAKNGALKMTVSGYNLVVEGNDGFEQLGPDDRVFLLPAARCK